MDVAIYISIWYNMYKPSLILPVSVNTPIPFEEAPCNPFRELLFIQNYRKAATWPAPETTPNSADPQGDQ